MPVAFDGTVVPLYLPVMPCGGTPYFDDGSGYAYRCDTCFSVIGSVGMPGSCATMLREAKEEREILKVLKTGRKT